MPSIKCCVPNCNTRYRKDSKDNHFFQLPADEAIRNKWIAQIGGQGVLHPKAKVCDKHFDLQNMYWNRIEKDAIPTLYLPDPSITTSENPDGAMEITVDVMQPSTSKDFHTANTCVQTTQILSANSPRKARLKSEIKSLQKKVTLLENKADAVSNEQLSISDEQFLKFCEDHFNKSTANLFKIQLQLVKRGPHGYRYSNEFKQFALNIFFLGPKVYRFLGKTLCLPSKSTLCRITNKWDIAPGISNFVFGVISTKVERMSEEAKDCVLCFDEMSLKTFFFYHRTKDEIIGFHNTIKKSYIPANNVLVLMARGIHDNWKQPVGYVFVCNSCPVEDLKHIIFKTIGKLSEIGLNVLAIISDQGTNFIKFARSVGVSEQTPYFEIGNKKCFYLFDIPHLLKSTRNNLYNHKFVIKEGTTSKKVLIDFYNKDKTQSFRLAPYLTDAHLYPNNFQKMKVKLAAQIFSASVAAGINTYIALNYFPASAMATAEFVSKMDNLFDVLNSQSFNSNKILNRPFTGTDKQMKVLYEMLKVFSELKVFNHDNVDITKTLNFINGWKITIKSILELWKIVSSKGVNHMRTRRLNQDALENFFGTVRQQSGNCINPTPIQFSRAFKKLFCLNYFQFADNSNCIDDLHNVLINLQPNEIKRLDILFPPDTIFQKALSIDSNDYQNFHLPEANALTYVAGYLFKKCLEKHSCHLCKTYSKENINLNETNIFSYFKSYAKDTFGNLIMPGQDFLQYIKSLEEKFCKIFPELSVTPRVGLLIKEQLLSVPYTSPCPDFPKDYLLNFKICK